MHGNLKTFLEGSQEKRSQMVMLCVPWRWSSETLGVVLEPSGLLWFTFLGFAGKVMQSLFGYLWAF